MRPLFFFSKSKKAELKEKKKHEVNDCKVHKFFALLIVKNNETLYFIPCIDGRIPV